MLFNRQETLELEVPKEVILYYINNTQLCTSFDIRDIEYARPSVKYFLELIDQLATIGVENFNIVVYDTNRHYFEMHSSIIGDKAIFELNSIISDRLLEINNRRDINSTIVDHTIEESTDSLRDSSLPKIFMASSPLQLLKKDKLNKNINYLLATEINENSYFIGSKTAPFILKGDNDKLFTHFLLPIKEYMNTPLAYYNSDIVNTSEENQLDLAEHNQYPDGYNKLKQSINHKYEHELLISIAVNMISKPSLYHAGQFVIIKNLFKEFFGYVTSELDMNLKASSTLIKDVVSRIDYLANSRTLNK